MREAEMPGVRKAATSIVAELRKLGVGSVLRDVCGQFHVTALEVCGTSKVAPLPTARAKVWRYLLDDPPKGPGWRAPRVAELFGVDPTTVYDATRAKSRPSRRRST
jgi:hypothetical protein